MAKVMLPSAECEGFDSNVTGKRYNASEGMIDVDDANDLAAISQAQKYDGRMQIVGMRAFFSRAAGVTCVCGFEQFLAMADQPCPKCGRRFDRLGG